MKTLKITKDYSDSGTPLKDMKHDYNISLAIPHIDAKKIDVLTWRDLFREGYDVLLLNFDSKFNSGDRYFLVWSGVPFCKENEDAPALYVFRVDVYFENFDRVLLVNSDAVELEFVKNPFYVSDYDLNDTQFFDVYDVLSFACDCDVHIGKDTVFQPPADLFDWSVFLMMLATKQSKEKKC